LPKKALPVILHATEEYDLRITVSPTCDVYEPGACGEPKQQGAPVVYRSLDASGYRVEMRHGSWRSLLASLQASRPGRD
jgi:hypothetical protein